MAGRADRHRAECARNVRAVQLTVMDECTAVSFDPDLGVESTGVIHRSGRARSPRPARTVHHRPAGPTSRIGARNRRPTPSARIATAAIRPPRRRRSWTASTTPHRRRATPSWLPPTRRRRTPRARRRRTRSRRSPPTGAAAEEAMRTRSPHRRTLSGASDARSTTSSRPLRRSTRMRADALTRRSPSAVSHARCAVAR